jgi:hypothetical protein
VDINIILGVYSMCCKLTYMTADGTHCGCHKYGSEVLGIVKGKKAPQLSAHSYCLSGFYLEVITGSSVHVQAKFSLHATRINTSSLL